MSNHWLARLVIIIDRLQVKLETKIFIIPELPKLLHIVGLMTSPTMSTDVDITTSHNIVLNL